MKLITSSYQNGQGALSLFDVNCESKEAKLLSEYEMNEPSFVIASDHLIFTYTKNPLKLVCLTLVNDKFTLIDELELPLESLTHLVYDKKNGFLFGASYRDGAIIKVEFKNAKLDNLKVLNVGGKCHAVTLFDDKLAVTNIENDRIYTYDLDLQPLQEIVFEEGIGPRHTLFNDGKFYFVTEYSNELFKYRDGLILDRVKTTQSESESHNATLLLDDGKVYASNRGEETISIFKDGEKFEFEKAFSTFGKHSRHMIFTPDKDAIISFNKESNNVTIICKATGKLLMEFPFEKASCGAIYKF